MGLKDSLGSHGPFSSLIFFFIEFRLDIKLLCFLLECLIFLFSLPNFFFIRLICFRFEGGKSFYSMKVSLPLLGFSWYGFGFCESGNCGLSGLNLTKGEVCGVGLGSQAGGGRGAGVG